jgi:Pyridoxamine 5'-phosphate oxidase
MTTVTQHNRTRIESANRGATRARRLTADDVWGAIEKASFAYLAHVTPAGEPRVSGVTFRSAGHRLYVATAPDSWKARHIEASGRVAVVVPVRRGGILSLLLPLPPATISFQAKAVVDPAGPLGEVGSVPEQLVSVTPNERKALARVIELSPEGEFLTYGLGVSLMDMMRPTIAQARVPVGN